MRYWMPERVVVEVKAKITGLSAYLQGNGCAAKTVEIAGITVRLAHCDDTGFYEKIPNLDAEFWWEVAEVGHRMRGTGDEIMEVAGN
jgi:hypothetical protein